MLTADNSVPPSPICYLPHVFHSSPPCGKASVQKPETTMQFYNLFPAIHLSPDTQRLSFRLSESHATIYIITHKLNIVQKTLLCVPFRS